MLSHFQRIHLLNDLQLKWSNYFLRVIPTLTHYSGIIPAIPSGSTYWIVILAFYPTFFLASIVTYFLANMLTSFLTFYLASILTFVRLFWHSILAFYLAFYLTFYSCILSGIYFEILFCYSIWPIWHSFWQSFWQSSWHSVWHSILAFSGIYSDILSDMNGASARSEWAVPTCPLRSGARSWEWGLTHLW